MLVASSPISVSGSFYGTKFLLIVVIVGVALWFFLSYMGEGKPKPQEPKE